MQKVKFVTVYCKDFSYSLCKNKKVNVNLEKEDVVFDLGDNRKETVNGCRCIGSKCSYYSKEEIGYCEEEE